MRPKLGSLAAVALAIGAVAVSAQPAAADVTIEVTTTTDGGPGSLRDAFDQANAATEPVTIVLEGGETYTLTVCGDGSATNASGSLYYDGNQDLVVRTDDGTPASIEQTCEDRVVHLDGVLQTTTFQDVVITGGRPAGSAAGIFASGGPLTLVRTTVTNNATGPDNDGGGVRGFDVTVIDSTISGNSAGAFGGGIANDGEVTIINSTIAGNTAAEIGGGIGGGEVTAIFSTIVGNSAPVSANVHSDGITAFGSVFALGDGGGTDCFVPEGATTSQGYNFDGDGSCGLHGTGDRSDGGDPQLGPLADNGGPTLTRAPQPGSPLADVIPVDACTDVETTDQRGATRPQGPACDVGAVETDGTVVPPPAPGGPGTRPAANDVRPRFTG